MSDQATELYEYERLDGSCAFQKVKFEGVDAGTGLRRKSFKIRYQTSEQVASGSVHWWTWREPPWVGRYPYELPRLFEAVTRGEKVYIVEGEKDAEAVIDAWGYAASTHPMGVSGGKGAGGVGTGAGWSKEQLEWFARAYRLGDSAVGGGMRSEIVIVADRDPTGLWLAARTYRGLRKWARWDAGRIRVVLAAVEEKGADVSDHLAADYTESSLVRMGVGELLAAAGEVQEAVKKTGWSVAFGSVSDAVGSKRRRIRVPDGVGPGVDSEIQPSVRTSRPVAGGSEGDPDGLRRPPR